MERLALKFSNQAIDTISIKTSNSLTKSTMSTKFCVFPQTYTHGKDQQAKTGMLLKIPFGLGMTIQKTILSEWDITAMKPNSWV